MAYGLSRSSAWPGWSRSCIRKAQTHTLSSLGSAPETARVRSGYIHGSGMSLPVSHSDSHVLPRLPAAVQTAAFVTTERRLLPWLWFLRGFDSSASCSSFRCFSSSLHAARSVSTSFFTLSFFDDAHVGCSVFQSSESPVHGDTQRGKSGYDLTFASRPWLPLSLACSLCFLYECPCRAPLLPSPQAQAPTSSLKTISQL